MLHTELVFSFRHVPRSQAYSDTPILNDVNWIVGRLNEKGGLYSHEVYRCKL